LDFYFRIQWTISTHSLDEISALVDEIERRTYLDYMGLTDRRSMALMCSIHVVRDCSFFE